MPLALSKPVDVMYIPLQTPADLGKALDRALRIDYRGSVSAYAFNGTEFWRIELNGPGNVKPVVATMGDVFVWHEQPGFLKVMPKIQFNEQYAAKSASIATANAVEVQWYPLECGADLGAALDGLRPNGYSGKVFTEDDRGTVALRGIEITGPGNPAGVTASLGDVLLWHDPPGVAEGMSQGDFTGMYDPQ